MSSGFDAPYWNSAQVLAWACLRDRSLVEQFRGDEDETPSTSLVAIKLGLLGPDGGSDRVASEKSALVHALQSGDLRATGVRAGSAGREEVPALEWLDLRLFYDPDRAMAKNAQGLWQERWTKLQFPRADVLERWPEIRVHASSGPPKDVDRRSLLAWMKHDVWTAAEALLLLHGKEPRHPWTEDHELTTHFLQAKTYLARALQGGTVGRRTALDGREQWVDTPERWYEWGESKFPIAPRVRREFQAARFADGPRVHFLHAKILLADRLADLEPEEIAMWVFDDELLAWISAADDAESFNFGAWLPHGDLDYMSKLTDTNFSQEQLEQFVPTERWRTYASLCARWAGHMQPDQVAVLIRSRYSAGELLPSHPIAGLPSEDDEPGLEDCLFALTQVKAIESDVGIRGVTRSAESTARATVSAETQCREWLTDAMRDNSEPEQAKTAYRESLKAEIPGLSNRAFDRAWSAAVDASGNLNWSRPGRKSKRRIDTPK